MVTRINYIVGNNINTEVKEYIKAIQSHLKGARLIVGGNGCDTKSVKEFGDTILMRDNKEITRAIIRAGFNTEYFANIVDPRELPALCQENKLQLLIIDYTGKGEEQLKLN